jgi:hypothetical protein
MLFTVTPWHTQTCSGVAPCDAVARDQEDNTHTTEYSPADARCSHTLLLCCAGRPLFPPVAIHFTPAAVLCILPRTFPCSDSHGACEDAAFQAGWSC